MVSCFMASICSMRFHLHLHPSSVSHPLSTPIYICPTPVPYFLSLRLSPTCIWTHNVPVLSLDFTAVDAGWGRGVVSVVRAPGPDYSRIFRPCCLHSPSLSCSSAFSFQLVSARSAAFPAALAASAGECREIKPEAAGAAMLCCQRGLAAASHSLPLGEKRPSLLLLSIFQTPPHTE